MLLYQRLLRGPWLLAGLLLCSWPVRNGAAQPSTQVRLYAGLETHDLGDLKRWQREQQEDARGRGLPVRAVETFPAYAGVRLEVVHPLSASVRLGLGLGYGSTGGRLHYADYSGEARFDQAVSRRYFELLFEGRNPGRVPLWVNLHARYSVTNHDLESFLRVGDESDGVQNTFTGRGLSLEPGVVLEFQRGIGVARFSVGFEYALAHAPMPEAFSHTLYYEGRSTTLSAGWTGLRLGIALGLGVRKR